MQDPHGTRKPNARRFHLALQSLAIETAPLYAELGIDPAAMTAGDADMSLIKYLELMELAAKRSGIRFLGAQLALEEANRNIGILGHLLRNAPNLEKAVDLLHLYIQLLSPGSRTELLIEEPYHVLTYKIDNVDPNQCVQDVEGTLTQFVVMIRSGLEDESWQPPRIYFEHRSPSSECLKAFPMGGELIFDHHFSGVCFPHELMHLRNRDFDPELLAILESQVQQSVESLLRSNSLLDHVQLLISANLADCAVTAETTARQLGMSRRTLHRRLQEQDTTFNRLRENIVLRIAKESLSSTRTSITELSLQLGYSDSSAFDRAFIRLTGETPSAYRRQHRGSSSAPF